MWLAKFFINKSQGINVFEYKMACINAICMYFNKDVQSASQKTVSFNGPYCLPNFLSSLYTAARALNSLSWTWYSVQPGWGLLPPPVRHLPGLYWHTARGAGLQEMLVCRKTF